MLVKGPAVLGYSINNAFQTCSQFPFHLKIPKPQNYPPFGLVVGIDFLISLYISLDFGDPEFPVGLDCGYWFFIFQLV
jgi:hypothetical protein